MSSNNNQTIITFLTKLIDDAKRDCLPVNIQKKIGEIYLLEKFNEPEIDKGDDENDILKFYIMGKMISEMMTD